jgi:hypothetical protein
MAISDKTYWGRRLLVKNVGVTTMKGWGWNLVDKKTGKPLLLTTRKEWVVERKKNFIKSPLMRSTWGLRRK